MISIIVPVYNVEKYIAKCLDSLLMQSYGKFELIIVNDGSTDSSGQICDLYASRDERIKVIHRENAGAGASRNIGMEYATGDYIVFIDSDDYVGPDYLKALYDCISTEKSDFVICGHHVINSGEDTCVMLDDATYGKERFNRMFTDHALLSHFTPWGKIFRKSIIDSSSLRFNQNIFCAEDSIFVMSYIRRCNTVSLLSANEYYYVLRGGSLSKRIHNFDSELRAYSCFIDEAKGMINQFDLGKEVCQRIYQWGAIFLDRIKLSALKSEPSLAKKKLAEIDWKPLVRYKKYKSGKEYIWDMLLLFRCYSLFVSLGKQV